MKTIVYVLFAFLLATAAANAQGISTLSIANLNVNPTPLVAGDHASITLQLYNSYQAELSDVNLRLEGSYPLLNFSPAQTYIISNIGGDGLYGGENTYFTFNVSVPADTPSGVYTLDLVATYQTTTTTTSGGASYTQTEVGQSDMPITVYVHGIPNVTASIVESQPILPGEEFSGEIQLQNIGGGAAKNITVRIYNSSGIGIVGSSIFNIGKLPSMATTTLPVIFQASQDIANGTYTFPLQVSYESNLNATYKKALNGSINVAVSQPQIIVSPVGAVPQTLLNGYNQSVEFAIENDGYGPAKNISISFYSGNGISMLGSVHSFFIGTLPQGGTATESIFIAANNTYSNATGFVKSKVTYYSANFGKEYAA
ncbi:MAG: COG1361 S-layer family protein, partial [Candidatus Micrarchaeia archaeon]